MPMPEMVGVHSDGTGGSYKVYCCFYMKTPKDKPCPVKRLSAAELKKHCDETGHPFSEDSYYLNPIALG